MCVLSLILLCVLVVTHQQPCMTFLRDWMRFKADVYCMWVNTCGKGLISVIAVISQHHCSSLSACLPGTFGTNCSQLCTCPHGTSCHHISGECGCPPGYTGNGCEQSECSQTLSHPRTPCHTLTLSFYFSSQLACLVPMASTVIRCVSAQRGTSCATRCQESATVLRDTPDPNVILVKWPLYWICKIENTKSVMLN